MAREHYQAALAIDPTNRIAERNIGRLRQLMAEAGKHTVAAKPGSKAPVSLFVEETGKTGFAHLVDLASPADLAQVNPGDFVELAPEGPRVVATLQRRPHRRRRAARRGPPAAAHGGRQQVRRRRHQPRRQGRPHHHPRDLPGPRQLRQGLLPDRRQARSDLRPYTKGTLVREESELEEDLEYDEEDESIDDIGSVLSAQTEPEEGFQIEGELPRRCRPSTTRTTSHRRGRGRGARGGLTDLRSPADAPTSPARSDG